MDDDSYPWTVERHETRALDCLIITIAQFKIRRHAEAFRDLMNRISAPRIKFLLAGKDL
jgi:hypothetical protein